MVPDTDGGLYARLTLTLSPVALRQLEHLAVAERRAVREQAGWLLEQTLLRRMGRSTPARGRRLEPVPAA